MQVLLNAYDSASNSGPFPNLAIMKLSTYHKLQGDQVALTGRGISNPDHMPEPDLVYVSCVFDWNGAQSRGTRWMHPLADFRIGGSGVDLESTLPPEVECVQPDYEIYKNRGVAGYPYAIGFSTRGCNRRCAFCIVPKKEGRLSQDNSLANIVGEFDKLLLLDNNLVQDPLIEEKLQWLADWGGQVNYSQGIDARVIERKPHLARLLADTRYSARNFQSKILTLAYDHPRLKNVIARACEYLADAGFNMRQHVQFFVLTNFNTTFEEDLARVQHLRDIGTSAYIMIYDKFNAPLNVRRLQRWCNNRRLFWQFDWEDYSRRPLGEDEILADIQLGDF